MKNVKTMYRKLTMMVVLGVLLAVMSCNNLLTPPKGNSTDRDSGSGNVSEDGKVLITIKLFTGSARMVMPDIEQLDWHITAEQGTDSIPATGTYPTYTLELPTTGPWTFTVKGTKENKELFTGTVTENVSNSTTSISIPLSPGSGMIDSGATGKLNLTIKPENVLTMTLRYRVDGGGWYTCTPMSELGPDQEMYWTPYSIKESNLSVGPHTLDLYFGEGSKFYFCTVAVNIWPGMTSDQWIKTNGEEYINDNGEFVITEEMVNEFVKTMGSVVFVDASVDANTPATGSIFAPVKTVSTAVDILRKANPGGNYNGTIMVSGATTITNEVQVKSGETLTVKGTGTGASITNDKGRVFNIASGGSLTLRENITLTGTNDTGNGGAVYVNGGTFTMKADSKITGSSASYGGGVYVDSKGTFTMGGGTISENNASGTGASGGGVCISSGTFTMSGGAVISGNTATSSGGGVFVSESGDFIMEGGTIGGTGGGSPNSAENGGGVYIFEGTFTMSGSAVISGNNASSSSSSSGGGVYVSTDGIFTMEGGTIGGSDGASANSAQYGGGVYVNGGEFEMTGTAILQGNTATTHGGGVHILSGGTFTMNGGTIGGTAANTATYGGGVFVSGGTFTVSGSSPVITNNAANNVYLTSGKTITIGDKGLTGGTIGVTAENVPSGSPVQITNGDVNGTAGIFTSDNTAYSIVEYKGDVCLSDAETKYEVGADGTEALGLFKDAVDAVNNSTDGGTITLLKDIDGSNAVFENDSSQPQPITFYSDDETRSFILDLNGKIINRELSTAAALPDGSVIRIKGGTLTIKDSSATNSDGTGGTGTITGGNTRGSGGGIHITSYSIGDVPGSLILESGSISGNTADSSNGGGIYIDSDCALTMKGGSIDGNIVSSADYYGGGVFVYGTFTMENGIITKNSSEQGNGGGVNIGSNGTFTMKGGTIENNTAYRTGGGVNLGAYGAFPGATMTLEGGTISGNTATVNGGGVGVSVGTFTMNGGTIGGTEPNTAKIGGGVYVDGVNSNFIMTGGTISGNTATQKGGGVYVSSTSSFTLGSSSAAVASSPVISENKKTDDSTNNVYLDGTILVIGGALNKSVGSGNIGITMATQGEFTLGWDSSGLTNPTFFFSDDRERNVALSGSELSLNLVRVDGGSCILNGQNVTLSSFWISPYEVTQEEFVSVMTGNKNGIASNPSYFPDNPAAGEVQERRPVERVRWYDAIVYCNLLSIKEGLTPCYTINGSTAPADWRERPDSDVHDNYNVWNSVTCNFDADGYRLPTEAEWEYAARGGNPKDSSWNNTYSGSDTLEDVAWYSNNSDSKTHEVGKKQANALGLYDMSGNLKEWCWNRKSEDNDSRVMRGGYYSSGEDGCQVTAFDSNFPISQGPDQGFRVVRSIR